MSKVKATKWFGSDRPRQTMTPAQLVDFMFSRPPGLYHTTYHHNDGCKCIENHNLDDCTCSDSDLEITVQVPE